MSDIREPLIAVPFFGSLQLVLCPLLMIPTLFVWHRMSTEVYTERISAVNFPVKRSSVVEFFGRMESSFQNRCDFRAIKVL